MIILGIDPGSVVMGFGIIETQGNRLIHIENGGIYSSQFKVFHDRLLHIFDEITQLIIRYRPEIAAIENVFYGKNVQSMLKLGQARGAAVLALLKAGLTVHEYTPTQVKSALTGYGRADKEQMQRMIKILLKLKDEAMSDASDALAVAICHSQHQTMQKKIANL